MVQCVTDNPDGSTPEKIAEMFLGLGGKRARRIIEYARQHADASAAA
jgi:hypothetical protein